MADQYAPAPSDDTLPAIALRSRRRYLPGRLVITIAYHPDIRRIGESVHISIDDVRSGFDLGRGMPFFSRQPGLDEHHGMGLADAYVSRRALFMQLRDGHLLLARPADASPVRVLGEALEREVQYPADRLRRGIAVGLANRIVVLLKEIDVEHAPEAGPTGGASLAGSSLYMRHLRREIDVLGRSGRDVLLTGETGTGKGEVARALHGSDPGPFLALNMSTLTPGLAAATLFGAVRGAYTGADANRRGYFQQANGGTLFLDEVGDTDSEVQPQLLRALEEREVQVVGGPIELVQLRIIAATDINLEDGESFRSALRFRLAQHTLHLLPLREHLEDLGELMLWFIDRESPEGLARFENLEPLEHAMWAELVANFLQYDWPGNIRELRNACGEVVHAAERDLPRAPEWLLEEAGAAPSRDSDVTSSIAAFSDGELLAELERQDWEISTTARSLGVSRSALYRRLARVPGLRLAADIDDAEIRRTVNQHGGDVAAAAAALRISRAALLQRWRALGPGG